MARELFNKSVNLDFLYPPFLEALMSCLMECKLQGTTYKVYSGHRPFDEQRVLYEKYLKGGPKAAPAGLSAHNYGLAIDCATLLPNGLLAWSGYEPLEAAVSKHGLITGASFGDRPHVQWPGFVNGTQLWPLKIAYSKASGAELEKLKVVWDGLQIAPTG